MTTQVQIRGTTQSAQESRTLVGRELDINTTDWRLCVHNGTTAGGIKHVNCFDQQNSEFNYAVVSGTNALTASMRVTPIGYIEGAVYVIKISANNTGSVTLNLNSLGAKTLRKFSNGISSNLEAGDLIAGMLVQVLYDGTYFQVVAGLGSGGTDRILWTPTGDLSSFTASDCVYVDLGYAVTVSFRGVLSGNSGSIAGDSNVVVIDNLPFNAETHAMTTLKKLSVEGIAEAYIASGLNDLRILGDVSGDYAGTITYIKD